MEFSTVKAINDIFRKKSKMKKLILTALFFMITTTWNMQASQAGQLTNNASTPINLVMYSSNYAPGTSTTSAKGRINPQGVMIPGGNNTNLAPGTTSIDIFYNESQGPIHATIHPNYNYTIIPASPQWIITQD